MNNLIKKIQNFAGRHNLWKKGDKIIIGVSGGPDSVCLLDILAKLAPKYNFKLHIAHVNYGLRGKDSDRDERFVKELAEKYGLGISVLSIAKNKIYENTKAFQTPLSARSGSALGGNLPLKKGRNLENKLREIRYDFFEKIRKKKKYNSIAVAHNLNDQAETVLMRLLRGTGLQGLRAMLPGTYLKIPLNPPLKKGGGRVQSFSHAIIRPLLSTDREEIIKYLKENKLKYQTDITNKDTAFFRNKIRHRLIPYLEKNYNLNLKKTLADLALAVADDYDYLLASMHIERPPKADSPRTEIFKRIGARVNRKSEIIFSAKKFQKLHPAIQRQYLRQMILKIKTDLTDIETGHIEEIIKIIQSKKSKIQTANFKGLKITKISDKMSVSLIK